jgi:Spy/CpxP family protein refolding chaperone
MNGITKGKAVVYLAAIFGMGLLAGAFAGYGLGRRASHPPPSPRTMSVHILNHLSSELRLTEDQRAKIKPVVEQTSAEIRAIHENSGKSVLALIQKCDQEIAAYLDPEQKRKLAEMQKQREESFDRSFKEGRRRRPPPPPDRRAPTEPPPSH